MNKQKHKVKTKQINIFKLICNIKNYFSITIYEQSKNNENYIHAL